MNFAERLFLPTVFFACMQMQHAYGAEMQGGQEIHVDIQISPAGSGCGQSDNIILPDGQIPVANRTAVPPSTPPSPPPPPVPPESVSRDPRRLVRYFCEHWKDENFAEMYYSMTPKYRKKISLKKFTALFEADAGINGGLDDENILSADPGHRLGCVLTVDLKFKFNKAKNRVVQVVLEKTKDGYRINECGLIPLDMDDL